jgi:CobQ-like glutamine amidotransferase family enzyme
VKELSIVHLYPNEMNTYGDRGNLLTLVRRAEWHGYKPVIHYHHIGQQLPEAVDVVLGGGGQDSAQGVIQDDVQHLSGKLHKLADKGVPMLMVCGCYQMFGRRFVTQESLEIRGIGIFDLETIAGERRMMGNVMVNAGEFGTLYGFENHSGLTYLGKDQPALGKVLRGMGNNGKDGSEGARMHNVFGTYLHGPVLPNNPAFADQLLRMAATNRYGTFAPATISDDYAAVANKLAAKRAY